MNDGNYRLGPNLPATNGQLDHASSLTLTSLAPTMPLHYGEKARALESDFVAAPSVDLSHHLSKLSKGRASSPLKDIFKYITMPGTC